MRPIRSCVTVVLYLVTVWTSLEAQRSVVVNRVRLSEAAVTGMEQRWNVRIQEGNYWYDAFSGAWGME